MKKSYILLTLVVAYGVFSVIHSRHRVIDGDEGYYASASRLVAEGKTPYADFFYPQAPILPFVYGAWVKLNGYSLAWLRTLSALLTAGTVGLWAWFLYSEYAKYLWVALTAFLVLMLNPFLLSWGVVVKTFALGNFLATATLISIWRAGVSRNIMWLFAAGVFCGLLVSTRLLYAAVPVGVACWIIFRIRTANGLPRRASLMAFFAGTFTASTPALLLYAHDPDVFMFNNLGYHLLRSETPSALLHFKQAISFLGDTILAHPYMIVVVILFLIGVFSLVPTQMKRVEGNPFLAEAGLFSTIALVAVSLIPIPLYEQYLTSPLAPFAVPLAASGARLLWGVSRLLVFGLILGIFPLSFGEFHHEMTQASSMKGWQLSVFDSVSTYIRNHTDESDTVISPWPGYTCESGRNFMPGFENQFGLPVSERLTESQRLHYRVGGKTAFISALRSRVPRLVVIGAWISPLFVTLNENDREQLYQALDQEYGSAKEIEDVYIYERRSSTR